MDELALARAKLAFLEENERKLVEQLSDVRAAASAQRKRIDELVQTRLPLIQHLPVELLLSIFHLALRGTNPSRKEILACVSRYWRDLIMDQPSFWSTIELVCGQSLGRVKEQLKRSREAPLDITIEVMWDALFGYGTIHGGLDLLVPCANRWRSLSVYAGYPISISEFMLDRLGAIKFPSLKRVELRPAGDLFSTFPTVLFPTNVHVLEHLKVCNLNLLHSAPGTSFSKQIPVLTLVTLSLSGDIPQALLQPNSIHFPVLETLEIKLKNAAYFFNAIVTPKLKFLDYTVGSENLLSTFSSQSRFSSVSQVSFMKLNSLDTLDALALCRAFPQVRHAEFNSERALSAFFGPCEGIDGLQSPADHWTSLESVTFREIEIDDCVLCIIREDNPFVRWLLGRQDQQPLRVRIKVTPSQWDPIWAVRELYDILREYCVVELEDLALCRESELSKSVGSRLQLVSPYP